jgi:hypothetical protein
MSSISTSIDAEAARKVNFVPKVVTGKDGKPVFDKKTGEAKTFRKRDTSEWDERSKAFGDSSATGMTQFLDGSWISLAFTEGTRLNQWVRGKGWLTTKNVTIERKRKRRNRKTGKMETVTVKTEKPKPVFVLSNGSLVFSKKDDLPGSLAGMLSCKPYMAGRRTATDKHLQALLDLRYVPEHAIFAAVDYAVLNMKGLANAGYPVASLNDADKAKVMYLCHLLGLGDAIKFVEKTLTEKRSEDLLKRQVNDADAKRYYGNNNEDWVKAFRAWVRDTVNSKIQITNFMCDKSDAPLARDVLVIADALKSANTSKHRG